MSRMLIAGRGWLSLCVALLANARGHDCFVIYEGDSSLIRLAGGRGREAISRWLLPAGLSDPDSVFDRQAPSLLYVGERWELLGLSPLAPRMHGEERDRFFHGIHPDTDPVFQKIREDLARSFLDAESYQSILGGVTSSLSGLFSSVGRMMLERRALRDSLSPFPWASLLADLRSVSGLSEKVPLAVFRILTDLSSGNFFRVDERLLMQKMVSFCDRQPGIRLRRGEGHPVSVRQDGRSRFVLEESGEVFDRVVDLCSREKDSSGGRYSLSIPRSHIPDCWPGTLLLPNTKSHPSMIWQISEETETMVTGMLDGYSEESCPGHPFQEIVLSATDDLPLPVPFQFSESPIVVQAKTNVFHPSGAYGKRSGGLSCLSDTLRLPFIGDDWFLSLYQAIPNLRKPLKSPSDSSR